VHLDGFGPSTVRKFLGTRNGVDDDELDRLQTEAFMEVHDSAELVFSDG
jgi:hypothetical protein